MTREIEVTRARLQEIQIKCVRERDKMQGSRSVTDTEDRKAIRQLRDDADNLRRTLGYTQMAPEEIAVAVADIEKRYASTIGRRKREDQERRAHIARVHANLAYVCSLDDE